MTAAHPRGDAGHKSSPSVIPAQAGIQSAVRDVTVDWIPAFAGMTVVTSAGMTVVTSAGMTTGRESSPSVIPAQAGIQSPRNPATARPYPPRTNCSV